jgi:hypothetical protein
MDYEDKIMHLSDSYAFKYADFMLKQLHESELEYDTMLRMLRGVTQDAMHELLLYIDRKKK